VRAWRTADRGFGRGAGDLWMGPAGPERARRPRSQRSAPSRWPRGGLSWASWDPPTYTFTGSTPLRFAFPRQNRAIFKNWCRCRRIPSFLEDFSRKMAMMDTRCAQIHFRTPRVHQSISGRTLSINPFRHISAHPHDARAPSSAPRRSGSGQVEVSKTRGVGQEAYR
jgi:hypothetical protein